MASPSDTFFDWQLFLPQRGPLALLQDGVHSTGDLSAAFIWFLLILFVLLSVWVIARAARAWQGIRFLSRLVKSSDAAGLFRQRRDLRQRAQQRPYEGGLWLAFDASLVEAADGARLYKTIDAAEFFNPYTLTWGLVGNRLLAAMPGVLTAFGILGTFVGLQIGLSSLDLSSPQVLSQSIIPLIQGAAVAFATSVWGTLVSVAFNLLEKSLELLLRRRINQLQQAANTLVSAHVAEQTLVNIERANVEAENALKGLAEQIGAQMQKALLEVPASIQAGIEASMRPAIERLVEATENLAQQQGDSASDALAQIVERFVNSLGESGEHSRAGLENASQQLSSVINQWSDGMEGFLGRLDTRATEFDGQMGALLAQGQTLREESSVSQQFLSNVSGELHRGSELLQQATQNLAKLGQELHKAGQVLGEHQTQAAKLTESVARKQQETGKLFENIARSLDDANDGLLVSSQALKESAQTAGAGLKQIQDSNSAFQDNVKKTLSTLRKQVGEMMNDYATDVEEQTKNRMEQWNAQTQAFAKNMVAAVTAMNDILGEIDSALARRKD